MVQRTEVEFVGYVRVSYVNKHEPEQARQAWKPLPVAGKTLSTLNANIANEFDPAGTPVPLHPSGEMGLFTRFQLK